MLLKKSNRKPRLLHVDMGKEFVNCTFKKLLRKYGIEMYHTFNEVKSSIIERFNRTMNEKLKLYFEVNQNRRWLHILPRILKEYNERDIHRTIGVPPAKVNKTNEKDIFQRMYSLKNFELQRPVFKIGDRVRITKKRETFGSKYDKKWTSEIFVINSVRYTHPITYTIVDLKREKIHGHFYRQELQKSKF